MKRFFEQLRINKERVSRIDGVRITFFIIFGLMFVLTEIGRNVYRPYIYSHGIFDYWIADTIGNFTGSITVVYFNLTISYPPYRPGRVFIIFITLGLIVYELVQYILPGRNTCDWRDIVATVVGGLLSWGMYEIIYRLSPNGAKLDRSQTGNGS